MECSKCDVLTNELSIAATDCSTVTESLRALAAGCAGSSGHMTEWSFGQWRTLQLRLGAAQLRKKQIEGLLDHHRFSHTLPTSRIECSPPFVAESQP